MPRQPEMRCIKCGYDLRGQSVCRCPECEKEFHPGKPGTFLSRPVSGLKVAVMAVCGLISVLTPLVLSLTFEDLPRYLLGPMLLLGPVMMIGGATIAGTAMVKGINELRGKLPWVTHQWGFRVATIVGAIAVGSFFVATLGQILYRTYFK